MVASWDSCPVVVGRLVMGARRCDSCVFFVLYGDSDTRGHCHRYPPKDGEFPPVPIHMWCGEHQEAADEQRE